MSEKKYFQVFIPSYSTDFPFIKRSRKGERYAFCSLCCCDVNISHAGRRDILLHVNTKKHKDSAKLVDSNGKLGGYFSKADLDTTTRAECLFTAFLIEHNVPFTAADHAGDLFRKMFPDSKEAKNYACARTKTTAIVKEMANKAIDEVISHLQHAPFSVATDGSNDAGNDAKLYPIVVTFCDSTVRTALLAMPALEGNSTGRNIGALVVDTLTSKKIPLQNCIGMACDNAPVMIGLKNGVAAVLKESHENIAIMGCCCHLINLAAQKGSACLPLNVDELLVDIFYYLEKSSKRKDKLKAFQSLHDVETKKILKHVSTRWLSLGRSLKRLVDQWQPLLSFFHSEVRPSGQVSKFPSKPCNLRTDLQKHAKEAESRHPSKRPRLDTNVPVSDTAPKRTQNRPGKVLNREERLFMFLSSDANRAYCDFLLSVIPEFEKVNVFLQSGAPQVHLLREVLSNLLREIMLRFVKPSVIKKADVLADVDYKSSVSQRDNEDIVIGSRTTQTLEGLKKEAREEFFTHIRRFFVAATEYMILKFPLKCELLKSAEVARLASIEHARFSDVKYLINRFPVLLPLQEGQDVNSALDDIQAEFTRLQLEELPAEVPKEQQIDEQWRAVSGLREVDGSFKYARLSKFMLGVLTLPHSNAECERVFSKVKKAHTQFRASMSKKTVEQLLVARCAQSHSGKCHEQVFDKDFLRKAKAATASMLAHPSTSET
ncbi:uncharacterized protein LOC142784016 [Rhipicephalus microplus]|uniref:uncharacterized protein LOC142784016 n=1 Tax=Rhipicephalus microplus TaxID=6941 RepID=UPI003F6B1D00